MSKLVQLTQNGILREPVALATRLLCEGNIIGVPTDTVYGFACNAQNTTAVQKLYAVKERSQDKPLAICVGKVEDISVWTTGIDKYLLSILYSLLPGPVTVILKRSSLLNPHLNPGIDKVGIRVPNSEFILSVANSQLGPIALTSANLSNSEAALEPTEFSELWPKLAAVFSNGKLGNSPNSRTGSTVVDLSVPGQYHIVRPGVALSTTRQILQSCGLVDTKSIMAADKFKLHNLNN